TSRELLDESAGEDVIAHELFHQWFGDYVTTESWSNLTVNESFANLSETLWSEYKYGKDAGDYINYKDMESYLQVPAEAKKDLVRFRYVDKEDMFDLVSYQKGGRVLNMLRHYLTDEVFFKGLNIYLKQNAFKTGEAHQLRLALEEASGKDLNWFFNQWFFNSGHPQLKIDYKWDAVKKVQTVYLQQTQEGEPFILPFSIDVYAGGKKERHNTWMKNKADTFTFASNTKPDLVNVDGDKILLIQKTDKKALDEYAFQYANAPLYVDRSEAIEAALAQQNDPGARKLIIAALNDKFFRLRIKVINNLDLRNPTLLKETVPVLATLAKSDKSTLVRAAAMMTLARLRDASNMTLFREGLSSQSYAVQGAALTGIAALNPAEGLPLARGLEKDSKGALTQAILEIYSGLGNAKERAFVIEAFDKATANDKFQMLESFFLVLANTNETEIFKTNFEKILSLIEKYKHFGIGQQLLPLFNMVKDQKIAKAKESKELSAQLNLQANMVNKAMAEIQSGK
ncbi:MAG TPA: M1 family aminopeptidase, partial [Daejeonella sp.]|nr:M1 family aminopeptidase [Daejeonella sp.]